MILVCPAPHWHSSEARYESHLEVNVSWSIRRNFWRLPVNNSSKRVGGGCWSHWRRYCQHWWCGVAYGAMRKRWRMMTDASRSLILIWVWCSRTLVYRTHRNQEPHQTLENIFGDLSKENIENCYYLFNKDNVMWCDVMWCDVMWCDVMWCDVM